MDYPLIAKKRQKNGGRIFFGVAVLFLLMFTIFPQTFSFVSSGLFNIAVPFWRAGIWIDNTLDGSRAVYLSKKTLIRENSELRSVIERMERDQRGYDAIIQQNLELQKQLSIHIPSGITGSVISRPHITAYDTIVLDIGSLVGVKKGDTVIVDGKTVIGIVEELYKYSSKVRLYSSPGNITSVLVGPSNVPAEITGAGGGSFTVSLPRGINVAIGDAATLPGSDNFIIGYVALIEKSDTTSFDTFLLKIPVNLFELKYAETISLTK